ncbi:head-tail connector protein [Latilactobacillus sakei]|uniref:head-tail connector protein n=1 Tax=Latilactobacillus sakei TaxID=1599 RepID=UPI000DC64212|nr:head-tail connector protein [Latilactobacillus sakei]SPS04259.1 Phage gp6-like head-tail connector protein [Latilactobacillus sakei]
MNVGEIKNYLRIDHTLDDTLINSLYQAGQEYIKNAIDVTADVESFAKYKLFERAALLLTAHWYENRLASVQTGGGSTNIPYGVTPLIQQLRGQYYYDKEREANDNQPVE